MRSRRWATWIAGNTATIAAGSTSVLVRTPIIDDALVEETETFKLFARVSSGTTRNDAAGGTGLIADNDLSLEPDLYVVTTDSLTTAKAGQRITYTISGGNAGEGVAEETVIREALPPGLRFVSASNGGYFENGSVVWRAGDLQPGATFSFAVTVVVEQAIAGRNAVTTSTIADRWGSIADPTPANNISIDGTLIGLPFAFDLFNNFTLRESFGGVDTGSFLPSPASGDMSGAPLQLLTPMYSGEAEPGSTLRIDIYNGHGDQIGSQIIMADAGGNWLVTFPNSNSNSRDCPASVSITGLPGSYIRAKPAGPDPRPYFSPAGYSSQFIFRGEPPVTDDPRGSAPLLGGLNLKNPFQLGSETSGYE